MHLKTISERLGAVLAPSWGRLGSVLARLSAILGRLGRILASQKPPKIGPKSILGASQDEVQHRPQLGEPRRPKNLEIPQEKPIFS